MVHPNFNNANENENEGEGNIEIPITLSNGVYLITIQNENGRVTKKIVKG